jgi:hypothetical protein
MRGLSFLSIVSVLAALTQSHAQISPPLTAAPKTPTTKPAATTSEVYGTIPESLVGTWLAISNFKQKDGRYLNKWHVYRFSHKDAAWHMEELRGDAPPELEKPMAATADTGKLYEIDEAALKAVRAALPRLTPQPEAETWSRTIWRSADQFPKDPPPPPQAEGAKLSIEFIDTPTAGMAGSGGAFYLKDISATKITGNATASAVVTAGIVVVPIDITGPLTMIRLQ